MLGIKFQMSFERVIDFLAEQYLRASFFYLNKMSLVRILSSFLTSVSLCILKNCGQIFKVDFFVFDPYWYFQF